MKKHSVSVFKLFNHIINTGIQQDRLSINLTQCRLTVFHCNLTNQRNKRIGMRMK
ncbi:MAG: hypothetical protein RL160_1797 [Bacteroidota bacterium]